MLILKWFGLAFGALVLLFAMVLIGARFADGPIGPFPGGSLQSGELVGGAALDLSSVHPGDTVELESSGRSRTAGLIPYKGRGYIPAIAAFPPGKSWHQEALTAPAAIVRVDGRRYRFELARVEDPALLAELTALFVANFGDAGSSDDPNWVWFFEARPAG